MSSPSTAGVSLTIMVPPPVEKESTVEVVFDEEAEAEMAAQLRALGYIE